MRSNGHNGTPVHPAAANPAGTRTSPARKARIAAKGIALLALTATAFSSTAEAQTPPKEMRIQVVPAEPGIRSILVNKRYRPIISRGIEGAVVETVTGNVDPSSVGCEVDLEVTLENSRVLRRSADICGSGGTVVVDVNKDPGPGRPRVVGSDVAPPAAVSRTPSTAPTTTTAITPTEPSTRPAPATGTKSPAPAATESRPPATTPPQTAGTTPSQAQVPSVVTEALDRQPATPSAPQAPGTIPGAAPVIPAAPSAPAVAAAPVERNWSTSGTQLGSQTAMLLHAGPQGYSPDFQASCTPQSGFATLRLERVSPSTTLGATVAVAIKADEFYATYDAIGVAAANDPGRAIPEFTVSLTDPIWDAMARKSQLDIILDGVSVPVSLKGSAQPVRLFTATCAEPQQIVEESQDPALAGAGELSCAEFGAVRSLDGGFRGRMIFRNARSEPVDVFWIDYSGGQRFYARLLPGQVLDQESILSNAWMASNTSGQCLGLYISRAPRQDVVIGNRAPSANSLPPQPVPTGPLPPAPVGGVDPVNYLCTAGIDLQVLFDAGRDVAVLTEFGQLSITLPRVPGGSGFRYESSGYSFAGQRDNATWSRPGLYDAFCSRT